MKNADALQPPVPLSDLLVTQAEHMQGEGSKSILSDKAFNRIARGETTVQDVEVLNGYTEWQNRAVLERLRTDVSVQGFDEFAGLAFVQELDGVFDRARQNDPAAAHHVLTYPFFNGFMQRVIKLLANKGPSYQMAPAVAARIAHETGATAAAAAIRCDVPCNVVAYVHREPCLRADCSHKTRCSSNAPEFVGKLVLPSVGTLKLPEVVKHAAVRRHPDGRVVVGSDESGFEMTLPQDITQSTPDWLPVHTLRAEAGGHTITAALDDLHYDRSVFPDFYTGRLSGGAVERWREHFQGAWEVLSQYVPDMALAIAGILRVIIPFRTPAGRMFTVSHSATYGATGLSMPTTAVHLARELAHEMYGHNVLDKLGRILPLPNVLRRDGEVYYSPWRTDGRPYIGHAHGTYAHTILAKFARALSEQSESEDERRYFAIEFARWRAKVEKGAEVLAEGMPEHIDNRSGSFLNGMFTSIKALRRHKADKRFEELAQDEVRDHQMAWTLANMQVHSEDIDALSELFLENISERDSLRTNLPLIRSLPPATYAPRDRTDALFAKRQLFDTYQDDPGLFQDINDNHERRYAFKDLSSADVSLVNGDYVIAANEYELEICYFPNRLQPWVGFLAAFRHRVTAVLNGRHQPILLRPDILQPLYALVSDKRKERGEGLLHPQTFLVRLIAMTEAVNKDEKDEVD